MTTPWPTIGTPAHDYIHALTRMDWQYQFSDDQRIWRQGTSDYAALQQMQRQHDAEYIIWNRYAPKEFIK